MALPFYEDVPSELQKFVRTNIIPQYNAFDNAHQCDHAETVIEESMKLAKFYDVRPSMVYTIAACHDLGLCEGREHHHEVSARIICNMQALHQWFSEKEIRIMAEAAEDHRASSQHEPRSIYGRIVAEADRLIEVELVLRRTVQYGLSHYPKLSKTQHYIRFIEHLHEKYATGGYLKLWIPKSSNAEKLEQLRRIIALPEALKEKFEILFTEEYSRRQSSTNL